MTVILREKTTIRGERVELKVFRPSGLLSRENQERAEKLDDFLSKEVPLMAERIMCLPKGQPLKKWYQFGKELQDIVDDNDLVLRTDVQSGLIWEAIKQHLPESIGLKGAGVVRDANAKYDGRRGHFPGCYAIATHAWEDVRWLKRWADWTHIYHRESMWHDKRVLRHMRAEIKRMGQYPSRDAFCDILKLVAAQTTGKDINVLDDSAIAEKVHHAFEQTQLGLA